MSEAIGVPANVRTRLSVMMFLQYAIWGAWLPLLWPFLNGHRGMQPNEIGDMFAVGAVGAIIAPFIAGQIADRYFATERFLGISHIVGGLLVLQLATINGYWAFLGFSLAYSLIYSPTLSLTNSLSFHHLPDRDKDFSKVRVWGTVGWIVVGIGIGQWLLHSHTPNDHDAAQIGLAAAIDSPEERSRLLDLSTVTLTSGEVIVGEVVLIDVEPDVDGGPQPLATYAITQEATTDDADSLREVPGNNVQSFAPLYASLASEGHADAIGEIIRGAGGPEARKELIPQRDDLADIVHTDVIAAGKASAQQAGMADAFRLSAVLGILMGIYCFTLPHTPPSREKKSNATMKAIQEVFQSRPLTVLFLLLVPVSCIHQFYFVHASGFLGNFQSKTATAINDVVGVGGGGLMTIGQMAEILVLALMPLALKKLDRKTLLTIGLVAYGLRMAIFAYAPEIHTATGIPGVAILMAGVALHGLCFGAFIFVSFVIVDELTTPDIRASAQSLYALVIFGIGIIVGSKVAGSVATWATSDSGSMDYAKLFSIPMWASVACLILLLVFYPKRSQSSNAIPPLDAESDAHST